MLRLKIQFSANYIKIQTQLELGGRESINAREAEVKSNRWQ